ncbi:hypothetical protein S83_015573, partial [Arachis hypogaea]
LPPYASRKEKKTTGLEAFFHLQQHMEPQPTINNVLQSKKIMKKCDIAIARWMVDASMPFNAINLAYYQLMIDATVNMGAGYECLNFDRICGYLLSKLVVNVKKMIEHY